MTRRAAFINYADEGGCLGNLTKGFGGVDLVVSKVGRRGSVN